MMKDGWEMMMVVWWLTDSGTLTPSPLSSSCARILTIL